uniref:F-box domain-containing protein n=1 Tax=Arundo donax TaxID=35708 RepID=A0A0A9FWF5_ARUDO
MLTDDILLAILARVNITTATRTSLLSTRWKHLPWLLPELSIDIKDFLYAPHLSPVEAEHMEAAMASLTTVSRSFLATPWSEATITRLQLKLYLVNNYSDVIGPLSEAIDMGTVKDLDLAILDEKEPDDCYDEEMLQQARW